MAAIDTIREAHQDIALLLAQKIRLGREKEIEEQAKRAVEESMERARKQIKEDECDYQSLLATSTPDYDEITTTYSGAPIGFSAKVTKHINAYGFETTSIIGNVLSSRPRYEVWCQSARCSVCYESYAPSSPSSCSSYCDSRCSTPSSMHGGGVRVVSPRSSPVADIEAIEKKALEGMF